MDNVRAAQIRERVEADALRGWGRCRDWALRFSLDSVICLLAASWLAGGRSIWPVAIMLVCAAALAALAFDCGRLAAIWARLHRKATGRWPWAGDKKESQQ